MSDLIFKIAITANVVNALFYLIWVNKQNPIVNTFGLFIIASALAEIVTYFTASAGNNLFLMPIYTVLEFALLSCFFILAHDASKKWVFVIILGILLIAVNSIFFQELDEFNTNAKTVIYLIIIVLSLYTLFTYINFGQVSQTELTMKYFLFGLLLNFTGSFVLYLFANVISTFEIETQKNLWYFNIVLNIISQLLYFLGFWQYRKLEQSKI
ncbi:hypothetical protein [Portibacter marinus]|uniref:hypothetical protein n=1 Tax=Portibacter marinus TaxID=2898660 RepID=UPI001F16DF63|nr:hypothetical protein [Portibacter marinus]